MGAVRVIPIANDNMGAYPHDPMDMSAHQTAAQTMSSYDIHADASPAFPAPTPVTPVTKVKKRKWGRKKGGGGSGGSGSGGSGSGNGGDGGDGTFGASRKVKKPVAVKTPAMRRAQTAILSLLTVHLITLGLGLTGMMTGYDPFYVAGFLGLSAIVGLVILFISRRGNLFLRHGLSITTAVATLFWGMIVLPMTGYLPNGLGPIFATVVFCLVGAVGRSLIMVLIGFSLLVMWAVATNAAGLPAQTSIVSLFAGILVVAIAAITVRSALVSLSVLLFSALATSAILWAFGFEPYAIAALIAAAMVMTYHGFSTHESLYAVQMRDIVGLLMVAALFAVQALTEPGVNLDFGWAVRGHDSIVFQSFIGIQAATLIFMLYRWRMGRMSLLTLGLVQILMVIAGIAILAPSRLIPTNAMTGLFGVEGMANSTLIIALCAATGFALCTTFFIRAWRADAPLMTGLVALLFISQGVILGRWLAAFPQELVITAGLCTMAILTAVLMNLRSEGPLPNAGDERAPLDLGEDYRSAAFTAQPYDVPSYDNPSFELKDPVLT